MGPYIETRRSPRTWVERLFLWQRAYETKVLEGHREVTGRGPTPEASQQAAQDRWGSEQITHTAISNAEGGDTVLMHSNREATPHPLFGRVQTGEETKPIRALERQPWYKRLS
jgi:hypothetical protein